MYSLLRKKQQVKKGRDVTLHKNCIYVVQKKIRSRLLNILVEEEMSHATYEDLEQIGSAERDEMLHIPSLSVFTKNTSCSLNFCYAYDHTELKAKVKVTNEFPLHS